MFDRRVVITGTGVLSCIGNDKNTFWEALINGKCGLGNITNIDVTKHKTKIAGEVKNFDIEKYMIKKEARRLDKFCQYAVAAGDEALSEANLPREFTDSAIDGERVGVTVSSGIGGLETTESQALLIDKRGPLKASPLLIPKLIIDIAAGTLAMRYKAKGPNMAIVTACGTACHSIGEAFWMIKRDDADLMLAGGTESAITNVGIGGFAAMKAMSTRNEDPQHASRPFDANRDGFVMSEGSGVLLLEEYEHAKKRGADILAEIVGYGATADAYHITSPSPSGEGATRAIKIAMRRAQINPEDIGYINAHGTSTPLNDKYETMAIKGALGDFAKKVTISSTKGSTGHSLGAAGGLETIACVQALRTGIIPPTINYETPDPECDLNYTPNKAIEKDIKYAVNINLGFGGHNGVLILKKFN